MHFSMQNNYHPPHATLNTRCTDTTPGQPAGQPGAFSLPTPEQYTMHQEDTVKYPRTPQSGQAKSRRAYPGTNRASPTAGEPGAFSCAIPPTHPDGGCLFTMQPRLPDGLPPTGSTRSKQPPRPAGLGGRLTLYIKSPTDARTHPYSQRSMSHRTIRRPR